MLIICPNCFAKFEVDDSLITRKEQKFKCSNCGDHFTEHFDDLGPQKPVRNMVASPVQNAIEEVESSDPAFSLSPTDEDLSVQSLPEEFTPVSAPKKKKSFGGLLAVVFLLIIAGGCGYLWMNRQSVLNQFPNVQKGIDLLSNQPVSSELKQPDSDAAPAVDMPEMAPVAPDPLTDAPDVPAAIGDPENPTEHIMRENEQHRPILPHLVRGPGPVIPKNPLPVVSVPEPAVVSPDAEMPVLDDVELPVADVIILDDAPAVDPTDIAPPPHDTPIDVPLADVPAIGDLEEIILSDEPLPVIDQGVATPVAASDDVAVKDVVFKYDTAAVGGAKLYVQGIVSNGTDADITMPALTIKMYDREGVFLGEQVIPATASVLTPKSAEFFFTEIVPLPTGIVTRVDVSLS